MTSATDSQAEASSAELDGRVVSAYLVVQVGLFLGLAWKWMYFWLADGVYHEIPIAHAFFPDWLRSADVVRWAYLGSLLSIVVGVLSVWLWPRRVLALANFACLTLLCVHQASYNDATFTTAWWTSLWLLWWTTRMDVDEPHESLRRGAFLARAIGSMILLGGAIGKWTPEYWSGEVFYDIYFLDRDYWTFNWLRERYDEETLRWLAKWYSRKVIAIETLGGFGLWLLPPKWAAAAGIIVFTSIALLSNFLLFSVLWSLIGLSAVGFLVRKRLSD